MSRNLGKKWHPMECTIKRVLDNSILANIPGSGSKSMHNTGPLGFKAVQVSRNVFNNAFGRTPVAATDERVLLSEFDRTDIQQACDEKVTITIWIQTWLGKREGIL